MAQWQGTKTNWTPADAPTDQDVNRWEGNTQWLYDRQNEASLLFPGEQRPYPKIFGKLALEPATRFSNNPIIPKGGSGAWDEGGVRGFAPLIDENGFLAQVGGEYLGYYYGTDSGGESRKIGLVKTTDPNLESWTKSPSNPVLSGSGVPGSFDEFGVQTGNAILMKDGTIRLYYAGFNADRNVFGIGLAESTDGVNFTRYSGNPIIQVSLFNIPSGGIFAIPYVVKTSYGWYCLVEGNVRGLPAFGLYGARSSNGIDGWTALNGGNPFLGAKGNTWTRAGLANPKLMEIDGKLLLTFNAQVEEHSWRIAAAETDDPDLKNFRVTYPFFTQGGSNQWDSHRIEDGVFVKDDIVNGRDPVRMFYFGTSSNSGILTAQIGLAHIAQNTDHFPYWLPDQHGGLRAESVQAPWGSDRPAIKLTDQLSGNIGYIYTRPFSAGRGVSVRFSIYVDNIPPGGGYNIWLRQGPDHYVQAGFTDPGIVIANHATGGKRIRYRDNAAGQLVTILSNYEDKRVYNFEIRLDALKQKYDVAVDQTNYVTDIDAGSRYIRHCFTIESYNNLSGTIYIGDVEINPI